MNTLFIRQIAVASLLAYAFTAGVWHCQATSYTWNGGGDWSVASNGTPNGVPGANDTATISSGTVNVSADTTVGNLNLTGGSIAGGAVLSVASNFTWTAGTMSGSGTTRLLAGGTGSLSGGAPKFLVNTRRWENGGTVSWEGGGIGAAGSGLSTI